MFEVEETKPKPFVFVLMPFGDEFREIYQLGIKSACQNAGAYCERVDEQIFVESILSRIYNQIAKADIIVADMTHRNPNVFYETGYAHALNKRVILLTQNVEDIPFDLQHYPHIVYKGKIIPLQEELELRIRWCIANPQRALASADISLEFLIDGILLVSDLEADIPINTTPYGAKFELDIAVHNLGASVIEVGAFRLAVVMPDTVSMTPRYRERDNLPHTKITGQKKIRNLVVPDTLFPDGWYSWEMSCDIVRPKDKTELLRMALRLFTEVGAKEYPFVLRPQIELPEEK